MIDSQPSYPGGLFHADLPGGRSGALIKLIRAELVAEAQCEGQPQFAIPLHECQLDLGGASGKMLFCRNADRSLTIFSEDPSFTAAIAQSAYGTLETQLQSLRAKRRGEANRFRIGAVVATLVFALVCVGGYFGVLAAARTAVRALPIRIDEQIGEMAIQSLVSEQRLDANHPATVLTREIVKRLQPHAAIPEMNFRVLVVESDEVNAFALPGGQMVVYTGLLKKAQTPEQVAGVIAHEMSHATLRHGLQSVSQSLGIVAAMQFLVGDIGGLVSFGSQIAQKSILTSYSRAAETEADLEGARMLHEAGIDPGAMAEFFGLLNAELGDIPDVAAWISTHPQHARRVENIAQLLQGLPKKEYRSLDLDLQAAQQALH